MGIEDLNYSLKLSKAMGYLNQFCSQLKVTGRGEFTMYYKDAWMCVLVKDGNEVAASENKDIYIAVVKFLEKTGSRHEF